MRQAEQRQHRNIALPQFDLADIRGTYAHAGGEGAMGELPLLPVLTEDGPKALQRGVVRALSYRAALPAPDVADRPDWPSLRMCRRFVALRAAQDLPHRGRSDLAGARLQARPTGGSVMPPHSSTRGQAHAVRWFTLSESR